MQTLKIIITNQHHANDIDVLIKLDEYDWRLPSLIFLSIFNEKVIMSFEGFDAINSQSMIAQE